MLLTPEQMAEMDRISGYAPQSTLTPDMMAQMDQIAGIAPKQPAEPGFIDRIMVDAQQRGMEAQGYVDQYKQGDRSLPGAFVGHMASYGRLGNDVAGEVFSEVGSHIPESIKGPVKRGIAAAGNYIADAPLGFVGPTPRQVGQFASEKYSDFKQEYPRAAENVENVAGALSLPAMFLPIPGTKGTSVAGASLDASRGAGKFVKEAGRDLIRAADNVPTKQVAGTVAKEIPASKPFYQIFDEIGGGLPAEQVKAISSKVNSIRPKDPARAAIWDASGAQDAINLFNKATEGGQLSFGGAQALRADVNSRIKKAYRAGDDTLAANLMTVKEELTKALTTTEPTDITDVKLKNSWKMANHEFAKEALLEDLDLIAAKATAPSRAQPANSLATAIDGFLNNPKLSRGLLPDERKALEEVSKQTAGGELLRAGATRFLSTVGAAKGGPVGFIIGHYGAEAARDAALALKIKKLDRAYEIIRNRKPPQLTEYMPPKMLTDQRRSTLERNIEQRRAYEASKGESGAPINAEGVRQLALPSPDMPTPPGAGTPNPAHLPMTEQQIYQSQKLINRQPPQSSFDPSGGAVRPPASQIMKLEQNLKGIKVGQFRNMQEKLVNGQMSQSRFIAVAKKDFGLTETQARSLAQEVKKYRSTK
jgi:hypothetical protein